VSRLTVRERLSLLKRCLILDAYYDTKETGYLIVVMLSSSAKQKFALQALDMSSEEVCVACGAAAAFTPSTPWSSTCATCQLENQRCCYTYEIADFTRREQLIAARSSSLGNEQSTYQPTYQLRYCPLCELPCFQMPEERYAESIDVLDHAMDDQQSSAGPTHQFFDWLYDAENCQRCPFCTLSLCPL
jgi:hypothetical protein